ncbi:membrane protein [Vibrio metoecus]|uniref:Membrane protein n=1 Tax=Vibrio metoecus TaxID=1481663 RepID=A0A0Q0TIR0_VIBMT|nr:porin [Vibrio metoecus]KQB01986.1 membrane protein [Vibrio metoecus]PAR52359.1 porin [Vibrio metoecus]
MDKMFKRTLLASAVAMVAAAGSANAAIDLNGKAVQVYGQAAGSYQIWTPDADGKDTTASVEIESRVGFRGEVEFEDFSPNFVWQIESGNAAGASGSFGVRDTYVGLAFDGVGSIKYGRQLVAAYNYVDWPHTNPGLGNVFDWYNPTGAALEDRADNVLRFDSVNLNGFNFQATVSNMAQTVDGAGYSLAGSYTQDMFSVHAGYYGQGEYTVDGEKKGDSSFSIIGGQLYLGPVTLTAGYKMVENGLTDNGQDSVSASAQYVTGNWLYKLGYAHAFDTDKTVETEVKKDSPKVKNNGEATAITARVMYMLPSYVIYFDVRNYDLNEDIKVSDGTRTMLGMEYYF